MNLSLFFTILTSLGIFEVFRKILDDFYDYSILKKSEEIRFIAKEVLEIALDLKNRSFAPPMSNKERKIFMKYASKADNYNKQFGTKVAILVNDPVIMDIDISNKVPEDYIHQKITKLRNNTDELIEECNHVRFSAAILLWYESWNSKK